MASQWDLGNFKPIYMSEILGYPRQMPLKYENWIPRFTSNDGVRVKDHMDNFWAFFQLHPISDDAKDLAMLGNGMMISLMLTSHLWTS